MHCGWWYSSVLGHPNTPATDDHDISTAGSSSRDTQGWPSGKLVGLTGAREHDERGERVRGGGDRTISDCSSQPGLISDSYIVVVIGVESILIGTDKEESNINTGQANVI